MQLEPADFRYAQDLGYVIKLLALARQDNGRYEAAVHPALVPQDAPLSPAWTVCIMQCTSWATGG